MDELSRVFFTLIQLVLVLGFFGGIIYLYMLFLKKMPSPKSVNPNRKPDNLDTIKEAIKLTFGPPNTKLRGGSF
jgi:hypothetical protein